MNKAILITLLSGIISAAAYSQKTHELYMPREFKQAYENQTRQHDGQPGKNYFQNRADYKIIAEFYPETKVLVGHEKVVYHNNSPDSLHWVYVHLYQNYFKKGEARISGINPKDIHEGVEVSEIKFDGSLVDTNSIFLYSTLMAIRPPHPIPPNSKVDIEMKWKQPMPATAMFRLGTYEESNFFLGLWYPKVAVYDDIVGWSTFGFNGNAEFYNEYGDYEVEIVVPSEYLVWSSGQLQNSKEILTQKYIERIDSALSSSKVISVVDQKDLQEKRITKPGDKHAWVFKAENYPDFALAIGNSYLWDATNAQVKGERILVNAIYPPNTKNFHTVAELSKKSIEFYSDSTLAIPYPYKQFTAFQGARRGMEYPGMMNNQDQDDAMGTCFISTHEVAHTYFPFYVGLNEQQYAWMDEGLASVLGFSAMASIMGIPEEDIFKMALSKYRLESAQLAIDLPMMAGTHNAGDFTYGFMAYVRPITAFYLLYQYMGKESFYLALNKFAEEWKGKHPIPYDLFHAFNKVQGEDLGWFWKPWFFELAYADLGIGAMSPKEESILIDIENQGGLPVPISIKVTYSDGKEFQTHKSMDVWKESTKVFQVEVPYGDIVEISLNEEFPETYSNNNRKVLLK